MCCIDTAGIRRKGKTREKLEKISIIKALQSIDRSHVCILLVDASEGPSDQDLHIAGYFQDRSRACIVGVNKWDVFDSDPKARKNFLEDLKWRLRFMPFAPVLTLSALTGKGAQKVLPTVREVFAQYNSRISTGILNRALKETIGLHEPPWCVATGSNSFMQPKPAPARLRSFFFAITRKASIFPTNVFW